MLDLIHLTGMEKTLKNQYQDASNISTRINLHSLYSRNPQGWFPWIFEQLQLKEGLRVLEIGCGDGSMWYQNLERIPADIRITLSDISVGMLRDARRNIGSDDLRFSFRSFDCQQIPYEAETFDIVIANHVLFYCENVSKTCQEICRVLKPGGRLLASTYGADHMKEVSELASGFDDRIILAAGKLDENSEKKGTALLRESFHTVIWIPYEDALEVPDAEPLISYILSCHGNQNQYLLDRYKEFCTYVRKKTAKGFHITKDAGIFLCEKS